MFFVVLLVTVQTSKVKMLYNNIIITFAKRFIQTLWGSVCQPVQPIINHACIISLSILYCIILCTKYNCFYGISEWGSNPQYLFINYNHSLNNCYVVYIIMHATTNQEKCKVALNI